MFNLRRLDAMKAAVRAPPAPSSLSHTAPPADDDEAEVDYRDDFNVGFDPRVAAFGMLQAAARQDYGQTCSESAQNCSCISKLMIAESF